MIRLSISLLACLFWSSVSMAETQSTSSQHHDKGNAMTFDYLKQKDDFWTKNLSGETLQVCRYHGTERSGTGQYDHFYENGTYYCACCGGDHAIYSSKDKFNSGTGWPSFYKPIEGGIIEREDPHDKQAFLGLRNLVLEKRTEVICSRCHSHLGHVFDDAPKEKGRRYCMNSAALTFVKEGETPKRTYAIEIEKE